MSATHTNRLINETSPYLLQHAHNPVDWYAWGPEAFEASRKQDKPIFLSVGYSTCYWCHVMERECFENEAIAKLMNDLFICIKVDREERPDVDQLYMTAVQVMTRQGGWPMSVFLFPDLRPFYGGTYFPPRDAHGRPGFPTLMRAIDDAYRNRRGEVSQSADEVIGIIRQLSDPRPNPNPILIDDSWVADLVGRSFSDYDATHGGFGGAPKFPRETLLELGLTFVRHHQGEASDQLADMLRHTLHAMADGGMRDQLGGGFHRYSTDAQWLVPHFEIMLYDNALLAWCYAEAAELLNEPRFGQIADRICQFVLGEMTSPSGVFYTAIDAEVDAREGASYLWTQGEVIDTLTNEPGKGMGAPFDEADAHRFCRVYGLDRGPNFADPHHDRGVAKTNVLYLPHGAASEEDPEIERMRRFLYDMRRRRKQPLLDTKIITSWNALMIRGIARVGKALGKQQYIDAAARAMTELLRIHRREDGALIRVSREGSARIAGFLDDEAGVCVALTELADATGDLSWMQQADERWQTLVSRFGNDAGGFFFTDANAADQIVRQKTGGDSPLPSGNGLAALAALKLGQAESAAKTLAIFAGTLEPQAESMSTLLQAALEYVRRHGPLSVGPRQSTRPTMSSPADQARDAVLVTAEWASPTRIEVKLQIADGYHINGRAVEEPLIPTELRVHSGGNIASQFYPSTNAKVNDLPVYSGGVLLAVTFVKPPTSGVKMTLIYQPCSETACLPTVTHQIELLPVTETS